MLRKRPPGELITVNEYFAAHPKMMLGEMRMSGRMYARGEPTLVRNGHNLAEQLAESMALLPKDVMGRSMTSLRPHVGFSAQKSLNDEEIKIARAELGSGAVA